MTVRELVKLLQAHRPERQVMILDGSNGGGLPREISVGPVLRQITEADCEDNADLEAISAAEVVVIGYGCY